LKLSANWLFNTLHIDNINIYEGPTSPSLRFILHHGDMTDSSSLIHIVRKVQPDEIHNLAAKPLGHPWSRTSSACSSTGLSSTQTTGSLSDSGSSYSARSSSMRATYSSLGSAIHQLFSPPWLQCAALKQDADRLPDLPAPPVFRLTAPVALRRTLRRALPGGSIKDVNSRYFLKMRPCATISIPSYRAGCVNPLHIVLPEGISRRCTSGPGLAPRKKARSWHWRATPKAPWWILPSPAGTP